MSDPTPEEDWRGWRDLSWVGWKHFLIAGALVAFFFVLVFSDLGGCSVQINGTTTVPHNGQTCIVIDADKAKDAEISPGIYCPTP